MALKIYLSGEIHTDWREQIVAGAEGLDVVFSSPVTDHAASDDCGVAILGAEADKVWHDRKGAQINAIRRGLRMPISSWCGLVSSTNSGTRRLMQGLQRRWGNR